jgi:hypothetical protein
MIARERHQVLLYILDSRLHIFLDIMPQETTPLGKTVFFSLVCKEEVLISYELFITVFAIYSSLAYSLDCSPHSILFYFSLC